MNKFISNFKKYKYLLLELIKKDIKLKYRNSVLGFLWTLIEPLLTMIVLTLIFSNLLGKGDDNFPVYILCGRLLYSFFASGTRSALKSVRAHGTMISKVYIPKYMYPLATIISNYIIFLISMVVLIGVAIVMKVRPTLYVFEAVIPLTVIAVLTMGVGLLLATLDVFFRDLEYLWSVILMLIMYTCAIFYKADKVMTTSNAWIFKINPLYSLIVNFRNAVFGRPLDMYHLWYSIGFSAAIFILGTVVFARKQDEFILYV